MPELFKELRFSILREFWTQEIRLPLLGGDAPRLGYETWRPGSEGMSLSCRE